MKNRKNNLQVESDVMYTVVYLALFFPIPKTSYPTILSLLSAKKIVIIILKQNVVFVCLLLINAWKKSFNPNLPSIINVSKNVVRKMGKTFKIHGSG